MFSEMLDESEREALLDLFAYLSSVDGVVSPEEVAFINEAAQRFGLDPPSEEAYRRAAGTDLGSLCARFQRPKGRAIALVELINIGFADGRYDESERKGVRVIGQMMGMGEGSIAELEDWVAAGIRWQEKGKRLMGLSP